jgi:hypothetical protein
MPLSNSLLRGSSNEDHNDDDTPKEIAALIADAFQEEEFFLLKVALAQAGYGRRGLAQAARTFQRKHAKCEVP